MKWLRGSRNARKQTHTGGWERLHRNHKSTLPSPLAIRERFSIVKRWERKNSSKWGAIRSLGTTELVKDMKNFPDLAIETLPEPELLTLIHNTNLW